MKTLYTDLFGNKLVLDDDGMLTGFNSEGEMLMMKYIRELVRESGLDITFHRGTGKTLALLDGDLLKKKKK